MTFPKKVQPIKIPFRFRRLKEIGDRPTSTFLNRELLRHVLTNIGSIAEKSRLHSLTAALTLISHRTTVSFSFPCGMGSHESLSAASCVL